MNALDLALQKEKYNLGEKVKGTIKLIIDSDTEIRSVKFLVLGIEKNAGLLHTIQIVPNESNGRMTARISFATSIPLILGILWSKRTTSNG
jgi:hypothetical protein